MSSLDFLAFFISSAVALVLIYLKVSTTIFQQIIAALLLILIIISRKIIFTKFRSVFLTLISLFVQLLVVSSGGFYSPFLILVHLFTLGISFLINIQSGIVFLFSTIAIMIFSTFSNRTLQATLLDDPGTFILYIISFVVIVPLAQFLMRTYNLKDTISRLLAEHVKLGQGREESILRGLTELILVTDKDLKIISVNQALEKAINLSNQDLTGKSLLELNILKDESGNLASLGTLAIEQIISDKTARFIEGFYLHSSVLLPVPFKVVVQIRPVLDLEREVKQLVFVIIDQRTFSSSQKHINLQNAKKIHQALIDQMKKAASPTLKFQIELLQKIEDDISLLQELEDHPIEQKINLADIIMICKKVVDLKQNLAKVLGVSLKFILPKEEVEELSFLRLQESNSEGKSLAVSGFLAPVDGQWLTTLVEKLLDIGLLVASSEKSPMVSVTVTRSELEVNITILTFTSKDLNQNQLFEENFGSLSQTTNLKLGSGLEGLIAKSIGLQLNLHTEVGLAGERLAFKLIIPKKPPGIDKSVSNQQQ